MSGSGVGLALYWCPWRASTIASATRGAIGCGQRLPAASRMPTPTAMTHSIFCAVSGLSPRSIGPHGPAIAAAFRASIPLQIALNFLSTAATIILGFGEVGSIPDGVGLVGRDPGEEIANSISNIFRAMK